ncbi:MAG: hypothetical protein AB1599_09855, partial [Planctomycetota bacterium]
RYKWFGPNELKDGFYAPETSELWFTINDTDCSNNSGKIDIEVALYKGLGNETMEQMKESHKVSIKTFKRNDIALVYFPVAEGNFFGSRSPEQIPSLGLTNPTELVDQIINKSTHLFGFDFFLYCESCDKQIVEIPDKIKKLNAEWAKKVTEAYERGKKAGVTIFIAELAKPIMGLISGVIGYTLLEIGLPESMINVASPILERLTMTMVLDPVWSEIINPTLADLCSESSAYLPQKLSDINELMPRKVSYDEIEKVVMDTVFLKTGVEMKLAGILPALGKSGNIEDFLGNILQSASSLMFVPNSVDGKKQSGSLVADDKYVNQLLVLEGLAKADDKDKNFPFKEKFKKSEQKAKR